MFDQSAVVLTVCRSLSVKIIAKRIGFSSYRFPAMRIARKTPRRNCVRLVQCSSRRAEGVGGGEIPKRDGSVQRFAPPRIAERNKTMFISKERKHFQEIAISKRLKVITDITEDVKFR